jgi:hypothetical protein
MMQRKYLSFSILRSLLPFISFCVDFLLSCIFFLLLLLFLSWYHLEQRDKNDPTKVTPMGSICYSIQIWPKDKAIVMPAGAARTEPNSNPFLPPPVGRLKFSWLVSLLVFFFTFLHLTFCLSSAVSILSACCVFLGIHLS